jgi:adenylyltransferase/sulfurtransferase
MAPCYHCLFPDPPPPGSVPTCAETGVLGVLPGLIGTIQATEMLKFILGIEETLAGRLLLVDATSMRFHTVALRRDPDSPACGHRTIRELIDYDEFCGVRSGEDDVIVPEITPRGSRRATRTRRFRRRDPRARGMGVGDRSHRRRAPIPLGTFAGELPSLDPTREMVVMCKSGVRSADAVRLLRAARFRQTMNLL